MNPTERPSTVPENAIWCESDNEWVLAPADEEGEYHGVVAFWRPDGTLVNHCSFEHGIPHGWYKRYHESGEVSREGHFVNGQLHGTDVFWRSEHPTTENFPHGLSQRVWRAEMDMVDGSVVAGRLFDKTGNPLTETGEPLPERPSNVPESASFASNTQRWLTGETDDSFRRHGLWMFFEKNGDLCQESEYKNGEVLWTRTYDSPREAELEHDLGEGRQEEARRKVVDGLASIQVDSMTVEGAWEVLGTHGQRLRELASPICQDPDSEDVDIVDEHDQPWALIDSLGDRLSPELRIWVEDRLPGHMRSGWRGSFVEAAESSIGAAVAVEDGTRVARLQSVFLPASLVFIEDEEYWIAEWVAGAKGTSTIWHQHQDDPTFYPHSASLAAFVGGLICQEDAYDDLELSLAQRERWAVAASLLGREVADENTPPPHLHIPALEPRTVWIVHHLLGLEPKEGLDQAPGQEVWEKERVLAPQWPHLQAYWMLHHAVFDNREALAEILSSCDCRYPAVEEFAAVARQLLTDERPEAYFWNPASVWDLRALAMETRPDLLCDEALSRLNKRLAPQIKARQKMEGFRRQLAASPEDATKRALAIWEILESGAGRLDAMEKSLANQLEEDEDRRLNVLMELRKGHVSMLDHPFRILGASVAASDGRSGVWRSFFEAAFDLSAAFGEEHASAVPGAIYGLGIALDDFDSLQTKVRQTFPDEAFGRRRRFEMVLVADELWEHGETPRAFIRDEARRFAARFSEWKTDTFSKALFILLHRHDPQGIELFVQCFKLAQFSGANWVLSMELVELCRNLRLQGTEPGLWAAIEKNLGRHDDADRARVVRAFAVCSADPDQARQQLVQRLGRHDETRKPCEDAALIAGLMEIDPETWAPEASRILRLMLDSRVGSMEFGAAVSLLDVATEQGCTGFQELARDFYERSLQKCSIEDTVQERLAQIAMAPEP